VAALFDVAPGGSGWGYLDGSPSCAAQPPSTLNGSPCSSLFSTFRGPTWTQAALTCDLPDGETAMLHVKGSATSPRQVFVAQQNGLILRFDHIGDPTPVVFADLRAEVADEGQLGLLGMALDPAYPARPYVYVLYSRPPPERGAPMTARLSARACFGDCGAERLSSRRWFCCHHHRFGPTGRRT